MFVNTHIFTVYSLIEDLFPCIIVFMLLPFLSREIHVTLATENEICESEAPHKSKTKL